MQSELDRMPLPDAFVVMYSVIDKASFQRAEEYLARLHDQDVLRCRPAILVGNKVDLVRSRVVSPQGKSLAVSLFHVYLRLPSWLGGFTTLYGIDRPAKTTGCISSAPPDKNKHPLEIVVLASDGVKFTQICRK